LGEYSFATGSRGKLASNHKLMKRFSRETCSRMSCRLWKK
jgi:hypothetical protein